MIQNTLSTPLEKIFARSPMFIYGKTATNGIAVMSYLAGVAPHRAGSQEIAKARSISRTLTAKLLTQLSAAGLITGQPGPGGGYTLGKAASEIRLMDIVGLFGPLEGASPCPFGSGWCGNSNAGSHCGKTCRRTHRSIPCFSSIWH